GLLDSLLHFSRLGQVGLEREALSVDEVLEMAADDHALRRCPRGALAAAMYTLAAGEAPNGALAAGGRTALVRLRRVLAPAHRAHPALRCAVGTGALITPVLPVLLTCHAGLG
ncbi:M56 family peptidase, partial [Streptomyces griseus]